MIYYLKRNQLDTEKYNNCISSAINSRIYAFSWYLDIVADNWDALVLNDYEAVMPLPWRKKYFIKYVYTPFWVLQLGVFSAKEKIDCDGFLKELFGKFKYVNLRMNSGNSFQNYSENRINKQNQFLNIDKPYDELSSAYRKDRKKDLLKAQKFNLIEKWGENPENLIELFKNNVGKRVPDIKDKDYNILLKLMRHCIKNKIGEIVSVYELGGDLITAGFFLKHNNSITKLVSATDFLNRNNGANTFLIDRLINKYCSSYKLFDFGGSSIRSVAEYSKSFNANTNSLSELRYNNLPFVFKLFKK